MNSQLALKSVLNLVGKLDDTPGEDTPRERFRKHLQDNVKDLGLLRDYIEECLRNTDSQFNRALQDLVNHLGFFLGFDVVFGRYQGTTDDIGYDGHWESPIGFHLVVEVKTSEVYPIKLPALVGYIEHLISAGKIPGWDNALGVYVVGRPDPEIDQLGNAIHMEKRTHQLRVISVDALLSLAEMVSEYGVSHEDILDVIRPSKARIDPLVDFANRLLVAQKEEMDIGAPSTIPKGEQRRETPEPVPEVHHQSETVSYWLIPVAGPGSVPEEIVEDLVVQKKMFALGKKAAGIRKMKPGDWVCFYAAKLGVVAHGKIKEGPGTDIEGHSYISNPEQYPWIIHLDDVHRYKEPQVLDASIRSQLEAFTDKDISRPWSWFVQGNTRLSEHDFRVLTRQD